MSKQLKIVLNPNPILRKRSEEIIPEDIKKPEFQEFFKDMEETMIKKDGAGLAAPQVGKNIRMVTILDGKKTVFLINPEITKRSWAKEIDEEGCLSVLNKKGEIVYGLVERNKKVNCIYLDENGNKNKLRVKNILARVIQHEIDHLDGILFIDKLAKNK
jgi:peptide deformylase